MMGTSDYPERYLSAMTALCAYQELVFGCKRVGMVAAPQRQVYASPRHVPNTRFALFSARNLDVNDDPCGGKLDRR